MSFSVRWYEPKQIILITYEGMLHLKDFEDYNQELINYLDEGTFPVHVVADTQHLKGVIPQAVDIANVLTYTKHENLSWVHICGANKLIRFLAAIVFQMVNTPVHFHNSIAEAVSFIHSVDTELQNFETRKKETTKLQPID